jgi:hypothetical protein
MNAELFNTAPRDYALELVVNGIDTDEHLLLCCLKYMSTDHVRDMLDCNELSPRFNHQEWECPDCGRIYDDGEEECTSDDCPNNQ